MISTYADDTAQMKRIGDIDPSDYVLGSDYRFHSIRILPVHIPKTMYRIYTRGNGGSKTMYYVQCSGTHTWTLFDAIGQNLM